MEPARPRAALLAAATLLRRGEGAAAPLTAPADLEFEKWIYRSNNFLR
jgi:hypothetical protein